MGAGGRCGRTAAARARTGSQRCGPRLTEGGRRFASGGGSSGGAGGGGGLLAARPASPAARLAQPRGPNPAARCAPPSAAATPACVSPHRPGCSAAPPPRPQRRGRLALPQPRADVAAQKHSWRPRGGARAGGPAERVAGRRDGRGDGARRAAADAGPDGRHPVGRAVLHDLPLITSAMPPLARLEALPPASLGAAYARFLRRHGFDPDERSESASSTTPTSRTSRALPPGPRPRHVLWAAAVDGGRGGAQVVEAAETGLPMCALGAVAGGVAPPAQRASSSATSCRRRATLRAAPT